MYFSSITTSANFTETNTCGSTLAAGKNCTISVTFTPTQVGALTGTLSVNDNGTNSPQTVSLSGAGGVNTCDRNLRGNRGWEVECCEDVHSEEQPEHNPS
jgi:hypothetical protein